MRPMCVCSIRHKSCNVLQKERVGDKQAEAEYTDETEALQLE